MGELWWSNKEIKKTKENNKYLIENYGIEKAKKIKRGYTIKGTILMILAIGLCAMCFYFLYAYYKKLIQQGKNIDVRSGAFIILAVLFIPSMIASYAHRLLAYGLIPIKFDISNSKICFKCKCVVDEKEMVCNKCGASFENKIKCTNCGQLNDREEEFCKNCWKELK